MSLQACSVERIPSPSLKPLYSPMLEASFHNYPCLRRTGSTCLWCPHNWNKTL